MNRFGAAVSSGWRAALRERTGHLFRRGRYPGLRTAKTTAAAVISFVIAERLGTSAEPVLAPLTALLVVQLTMYQTITHGLDRIASVLAGVLLAVGVAELVGLTWWSLGGVIAVSLIVGRLLRIGANLLEVPISAMIVLALGGSSTLAAGRLYETLIGAAVGVAVNIAIAPPLYVQPAAEAVSELADRLGDVLRGMARDLRGDWGRAAADRWLNRARELGGEVAHADRALASAEESSRFNPRGSKARDAQPRLRAGLTGLEHGYVALRSLCRGLLDRTYYLPETEQDQAYSPAAREALARALEDAAAAICRVSSFTADTDPSSRPPADLAEQLDRLQTGREELSRLLMVDPAADQAAWQQHGAVLASLDRLRIEIASATAASDRPWRPDPLAGRQRQAVKRVLRPARGGYPLDNDPLQTLDAPRQEPEDVSQTETR